MYNHDFNYNVLDVCFDNVKYVLFLHCITLVDHTILL